MKHYYPIKKMCTARNKTIKKNINVNNLKTNIREKNLGSFPTIDTFKRTVNHLIIFKKYYDSLGAGWRCGRVPGGYDGLGGCGCRSAGSLLSIHKQQKQKFTFKIKHYQKSVKTIRSPVSL